MDSQQTKDEAYWAIHGFFSKLADYCDVELEGTEYEDHGVGSQYVHKSKEDHKEAIRLLTKELEEQTELGVAELETWHEDYDDHESYTGRWEDEYDTENWDNPVGK